MSSTLNPEMLTVMHEIEQLSYGDTGRTDSYSGELMSHLMATGALGVHAPQPFATQKHMLHRGPTRHDYEETMARMFIQVSPKLYKSFMNSIKDPENARIANVLVGDNIKQGGTGYIDFLLQRANHALNEKFQVVETLADNFVAFFFGMQAPVFSYSGTLLNTYQDDWTARMFRIFTEFGRGTQLAKRRVLMKLRYNNMIVTGGMINFESANTADIQMACSFSFNFLVTRIDLLFKGFSDPTQIPNEYTFSPTVDNFNAVFGGASTGVKAYVGDAPAQPAGITPPEDGRQSVQVIDPPIEETLNNTYYGESPNLDPRSNRPTMNTTISQINAARTGQSI